MQATIYVTQEAVDTANFLKDQDYYDRLEKADETDLSARDGYYLKNANHLSIAVLPEGSKTVVRITPANPVLYDRHISFPAELRGCIFEKAPRLPERYAEIVTYWSGSTVNANDGGAAHFQNPLNEYMVDLSAVKGRGNRDSESATSPDIDALLSEGVVVSIIGLGALVSHFPMSQFAEIEIPIDHTMVGTGGDAFRSTSAYNSQPGEQSQRIFLRVLDILRSPDPDRIYIDLLRHELLDYGYFY